MLVGAAASYLYLNAAALAPTAASPSHPPPKTHPDSPPRVPMPWPTPQHHAGPSETLTVVLRAARVSPLVTLTDEQIHMRLFKGFFGGNKPTHNVWAPATQLPRLSPLHTLLFNAFLVLDRHVRVSTWPIAIYEVRLSPSTLTPDDDDDDDDDDSDDDSDGYVDFGFGNTAPGSTFCGLHRPPATRNNPNPEPATSIHIAVRVLPTDLDSNQGSDANLNHVSEITRSGRNSLRRV
ncbi:hypothetical protein DFH08DRAFT_1037187 [Mycena albidolilacea]|uniref:Uncharacterized protein n=1 Tax=Mycena albidolilacea TaxID=1033008 RepID=A0AAD7EEY2_9AGAR|nr:hypothetical protein DFH08DRAFT_1037187 [Mycena albidolilacea]